MNLIFSLSAVQNHLEPSTDEAVLLLKASYALIQIVRSQQQPTSAARISKAKIARTWKKVAKNYVKIARKNAKH